MAKWEVNPKLKTARSPGSITNQQHHDKSMSERDIAGSPGTISKIIANSATLQSVPDLAVIRVMNTTTVMQFLFIGEELDAPGGAPSIATGIAIPPGFFENFYCGKLESKKSTFIKSSDNGLQIVEFEL